MSLGGFVVIITDSTRSKNIFNYNIVVFFELNVYHLFVVLATLFSFGSQV
jgi:hypothetical protein